MVAGEGALSGALMGVRVASVARRRRALWGALSGALRLICK